MNIALADPIILEEILRTLSVFNVASPIQSTPPTPAWQLRPRQQLFELDPSSTEQSAFPAQQQPPETWSVGQPTATTAALPSLERRQLNTPGPANTFINLAPSDLHQFEGQFQNVDGFNPSSVDVTASAMVDGVRLQYKPCWVNHRSDFTLSVSSAHLGRSRLLQPRNGGQRPSYAGLHSAITELTYSYPKRSFFT